MLRIGARYVIDQHRYEKTFKKALADIEPVLTKAAKEASALPESIQNTEIGYREFINVLPDLPPTRFGARTTKKLIEQMAGRMGYEVRFFPLGRGAIIGVDGFVSWLWVRQKSKTLQIVYDTTAVKAHVGLDKSDNEKTRLLADQILAKIFLHEFGHASLHLQDFLNMLAAGTLPNLNPSHEQDAWLYAESLWGILIGDHAHCTRTIGSTVDESWKFA
jgi:hypothetical protein